MTKARWVGGLILLEALTGALLSLPQPLAAWYATLLVTSLHILFAALLVLLASPFLFLHIRKNHRGRTHRWSNWGSLGALFLVMVSGGFLLVVGQRGRLAMAHTLAAFCFLVIFFVHLGIPQIKRLLRAVFRPLLTGLLGTLIVAVLITARPTHSTVSPEIKQFPPASFRIVGQLPDYEVEVIGVQRCTTCHSQIVDQWRQSMHAVADTELFYARVVGEFRKEFGFEASNWCAGCHSPLRLGRGELNDKVAEVSQPNVDCIVCHSIEQGHEPLGNNNYDLSISKPKRHELSRASTLSDHMVLLQPAAHRSLWNGALMRRPEFCGVCHRQTLPDFLAEGKGGLVIQNTYQEWANSPYNTSDRDRRRTCQNCHMPVQVGVASDLGDHRPNHLFLGGSIDIARITGMHDSYREGKQFLRTAATLSLAAQTAGTQSVELIVRVTNSGAGHNLPTGVTDLRQVWIAVEVKNDAGKVVYRSGDLADDGALASSAVTFGMTLGDGNGNPVHLHHIAKARQILSDTSLPAGETREVKYTIPAGNSQKLRAEAKLLYRAVPQNFINHYMTPDIRSEVVSMAEASTTINVLP